MPEDSTEDFSDITQDEAGDHSVGIEDADDHSVDMQQKEVDRKQRRDQVRNHLWRIQATNVIGYYQFAILHFLQEVEPWRQSWSSRHFSLQSIAISMIF